MNTSDFVLIDIGM